MVEDVLLKPLAESRLRTLACLLGAIITVIPLLLAPSVEAAGPVSVDVRAQPTEITVGDPIRLLLTLRHPRNVLIEAPNIGQALAPFEVQRVRPIPPQRNNESDTVIEVEYTITIFTVGQSSIPPVSVNYTDEKGVRQVATSEEIPVRVLSVIGEGVPDGLRDIKPPVEIPNGPLPLREWGITGVAALAAVVSTTLLIRILATRRRLTPISAKGGPYPKEWAKAELERIAALDLLDQGEYKRYYDLLANCARRYLAAQYGPWAMACTTQELHQEMESRGLDRWQARIVYGLLDECDAVKWARYMPARERARQALTMAYEILDEGG